MAHRTRAAALLVLGFCFCMGATTKEPGPPFVSFDEFIKNTRGTKLAAVARRPGVKVRSESEFERMRGHVLSLYDGVKVANSFVLGQDHVDCIDINTQPALRGADGKRLTIASPPPPMLTKEPAEDPARQARAVEPMLSEQKKDPYGHVQFCRQGYIPMRRVTLEEISRFETLEDFFSKYGRAGEKGGPPEEIKRQ